MKVAIDLQACQTDSRERGIGRYAISLTKAIAESNETDVVLTLDCVDRSRTRDLRGRLRRAGIHAPAHTYHYPAFLNGITDSHPELTRGASVLRARFMSALDVDAVLVASVFEGFDGGAGVTTELDRPSLAGMLTVAVAYDVIPMIFPERYLQAGSDYERWYRRKLEYFRGFDLYLAISDSTKRDLVEYVGIDADRIRVIGAGLDDSFVTASVGDRGTEASLLFQSGVRIPFVFTPGNRDWRKNNIAALRAFAQLPADIRRTHQLVFTQVGDDLIDALRGEFRHVADRVVALGTVDDSTLAVLYRNCRVLFFPSLYEGFGLPVIEGMSLGAPVISSNAGALPEVIKDPEALFDPSNELQSVALLERALSDERFRARLVDGAIAHARSFSWAKVAAAALAAIKDCATLHRSDRSRRWNPSQVDIDVLADSIVFGGDGADHCVFRGLSAIAAPRRRRLLVDVTCVAETETRTGIQRVVRNYCIGLHGLAAERLGPEVIPFRWTPVGIRHARECARGLGLDVVGDDDLVEVRPNDLVFMLDSTWEIPERFDAFLEDVWINGGEVVWMVYDLVPIRVPETCHPGMPPVFRHWLTHAIRRADGFVCISESTRLDLDAFMDEVLEVTARRPWSRSVHLGSDFESGREEPVSEAVMEVAEAMSKRPWLAALGTIEPRKDYGTILDAYDQLWSSGADVGLVLIGKQGWNVDALAIRIREHLENGRRLVWLEGPSDGDVRFLLSRSSGLVQASLAEGFGLPIVEAGRMGVPLVLSDIPVFREIAGKEASYFPVSDASILASLISELVLNRKLSRPHGIRTMTWRESSERLAQILL
jgi:O-antigen biosynthesis alpha-1,2-mannosyltransferase